MSPSMDMGGFREPQTRLRPKCCPRASGCGARGSPWLGCTPPMGLNHCGNHCWGAKFSGVKVQLAQPHGLAGRGLWWAYYKL